MTDDDTGWDLNPSEIWAAEIFDAVWAADLDDPGPLADTPACECAGPFPTGHSHEPWCPVLTGIAGPLAFDREPVGPLVDIDIDWLAVHDGNYPHEPED